MDKSWVELSKSGKIVYLSFIHGYTDRRTNIAIGDIESLIGYEGDHITALTKTGEIKKITLTPDLYKLHHCVNPSTVETIGRGYTLHVRDGILIDDYSEYITSLHVKDFILSKKPKIILADGSIIEYKRGDPLYIGTDFYCIAGKMEETEYYPNAIRIHGQTIVTAKNGNLYSFGGTTYSLGKLFVKDDFAISYRTGKLSSGRRLYTDFKGDATNIYFVNRKLKMAQSLNDQLIDISDVVDIVQRDNDITITTGDGKLHNMTTANVNLRSYTPIPLYRGDERRVSYYVGEKGVLVDLRSTPSHYQSSFYLINGNYYTKDYDLLTILTHNFSVTNGILVIIKYINKINNIFIINDIFTVLSEFVAEIVNMEISEESDLFPLLITTKSANRRQASLFCDLRGDITKMYILFDDGEKWPLCPSSGGQFYSPEGPYNKISALGVEKIQEKVYKIHGNYIVFPTLPMNYCITTLYEKFGNYMIHEYDAAHVGIITIHKPHTSTKPARSGALIADHCEI